MSLTAASVLGCVVGLTVGWCLGRASSRAERQAMQVVLARAQQGEAEWSKLAVHRQAVIATLEARAVEDATSIEELRNQVAGNRLTLSLHFRRVHASDELLEQIAPKALDEARMAGKEGIECDLAMARHRIELLEEALKGVQLGFRGCREERDELRARLEAVQAGRTT